MFFVFNLKCFLLHVKQITNFHPPFKQVWINPGAHCGCGTLVQHHSSDECHILPFFSPSQCVISHCLQRRNPLADGAFTFWAVTQSVPVGCGAELRRLWELQEAEGELQPSPGLLGAPRALCSAGDAAAPAASRAAFSGNPWRLWVLLCQKRGLKLLICEAKRSFMLVQKGLAWQYLKHTKPFSMIAACGHQELGNQSYPDTNETLKILFEFSKFSCAVSKHKI